MYNGWPRTDLFDIVLRQHLIIKDANISPVSVETEVEEEQGWRKIGFCLVGGLIPGSTCCTILARSWFSQIFDRKSCLDRWTWKIKEK